MDHLEASKALADAELVPCIEGSLADAKSVVALCHAAEIPALLGREACEKPGCSPKMQVMVRPEDAPKVGALLRARWEQAVEGEGMVRVTATPLPDAVEVAPDAEPPCPACGTAAPLVDGACSDCGLQLE